MKRLIIIVTIMCLSLSFMGCARSVHRIEHPNGTVEIIEQTDVEKTIILWESALVIAERSLELYLMNYERMEQMDAQKAQRELEIRMENINMMREIIRDLRRIE